MYQFSLIAISLKVGGEYTLVDRKVVGCFYSKILKDALFLNQDLFLANCFIYLLSKGLFK